MCVSVQVLPLTDELKFVNVLDVVAFATPSMVTVPQVLPPVFSALPMLLSARMPFVAVTLVTPVVIVMLPQLPEEPLPLPIPAPDIPP